MALKLDIPVRTSITLPDEWQECQTPQQLSYWLIARFEELANTNDIDELKSMVTELRAYVDTYESRIKALVNTDVSLGEDITAIVQSISDLRSALTTLENSLSDLVRDVETNTNDITAVDGRVDLLHEANITNAQKIEALEEAFEGIMPMIEGALNEILLGLDASINALSGYINESPTLDNVDVDGLERILLQDTSSSGKLKARLCSFTQEEGVWNCDYRTFDFFVECSDDVRQLEMSYLTFVNGFTSIYKCADVEIPIGAGNFVNIKGFVFREIQEVFYTITQCSRRIATT